MGFIILKTIADLYRDFHAHFSKYFKHFFVNLTNIKIKINIIFLAPGILFLEANKTDISLIIFILIFAESAWCVLRQIPFMVLPLTHLIILVWKNLPKIDSMNNSSISWNALESWQLNLLIYVKTFPVGLQNWLIETLELLKRNRVSAIPKNHVYQRIVDIFFTNI